MRFFSVLLTVLFTLSVVKSDQSFPSSTASIDSVWYGHPVDIGVLSTDSPTDFFISIGSGSDWTRISDTLKWGDFFPSGVFTWIPDSGYTNVRLGIHTAPRGTDNFSISPTDSSDVNLSVQLANLEMVVNRDSNEIWADDLFDVVWSIPTGTNLPDLLELQMRLQGRSWESLDTINPISNRAYWISTDTIRSNVRFRLRYLGKERDHNIVTSRWSTFMPVDIDILNISSIENSDWNSGDTVNIEYTTRYLSDLSSIRVERIRGIDTLDIGTITGVSGTFEYVIDNGYEGITDILFYNSDGDLLYSAEVNSRNKYLELVDLDDSYTENDIVDIQWNASPGMGSLFITVETSRGLDTLSSFWPVNRIPYTYTVKKDDEYLIFSISSQDGFTELTTTSDSIPVVLECQEDRFFELWQESLSEIQILGGVIDSLSNITPDTITYVMIIDPPTSVRDEFEVDTDRISTLTDQGGVINFYLFADHIAIYDYLGRMLHKEYDTTDIGTGMLNPGQYILIAVVGEDYFIHKFVKN